MANETLSQAKKNKQDEFYTQLADVEAEMRHYRDQFRDKVVFCNCDDPYESAFFKYFAANFNFLGLKKLVATCYVDSPVAGQQLSLFDRPPLQQKDPDARPAYKIEITEVPDMNADGATDLTDVEMLLRNGNNALTLLQGDGDFRSAECVALLKEADIVATNPPFSLFREFVAQLMEHGKQFIILGNVNAITYKEIFKYIMGDAIWLGQSIHSGDREFRVPDSYPLNAAGYRVDENGVKYIRVKGVRWFTNMDFEKRHEKLTLYKRYTPEEYPRYDNYDAIEVSKVAEIPYDYDGVMGVPITFLDKYNPDQFEILGMTQRGCHDGFPDTRKYDSYWEVRQDGSRTGSSGNKTNENANLLGNDGRKNYFINEEGRIIQSLYQRIFIKHRGTAQ